MSWQAIKWQGEACLVNRRDGNIYWNGGPSYMPDHGEAETLKEYGEDPGFVQFCRDFPPKPTADRSQHEYWLAPSGDLYFCHYGGHDYLAEQLLAVFYGLESYRASDEIERRGWKRIWGDDGVAYSECRVFTQAQLDTLFDLSQTGTDHWREDLTKTIKEAELA